MDFRKIENNDEFNSFFLNSDSCHFLQSLEWGTIMKDEGWQSISYLVENQGKTKATVLILKKKLPFWGVSILYAPRAPVADLEDTPVINYLLSELKSLGKEHRAIFLRIDPDIAEDNQQMNSIFLKNGFRGLPQTWSYWNAPKYVLRLKLMGTEEELFSKMSSGQRNQIKSARKKCVFVTSDTTIEDIDSFFDLLVQTSRKKKIPYRKIDYYRRLYEVFISKGNGKLFFANHKGDRVATGITLKMGRKSWLMYLASSEKGRKLNSTRLLQWEMILWAKKEGCILYDFRGTAVDYPPDPNNPNYGVYSFKKEFEPELVILTGYYDLVLKGFYYKLFRVTEKILLPFFIRVYTFMKKLHSN